MPGDCYRPDPPDSPSRARSLPWAALLRRVHQVDVLACPRCHAPLTVLAYLTDPHVTEKILRHLGLPTDLPSAAPARAPPQLELDFVGGPDLDFVDPPPPQD